MVHYSEHYYSSNNYYYSLVKIISNENAVLRFGMSYYSIIPSNKSFHWIFVFYYSFPCVLYSCLLQLRPTKGFVYNNNDNDNVMNNNHTILIILHSVCVVVTLLYRVVVMLCSAFSYNIIHITMRQPRRQCGRVRSRNKSQVRAKPVRDCFKATIIILYYYVHSHNTV